MIMQLNKVHSVKTIDRVAAELGETVDRIFDLAIDMEPEDGVIWVYGPGDDSVIAFSPFGIENLRVLIEMDPEHARSPRRGLRRMLTENRMLREERNVLKKATLFFAERSK
jgi:hypothetical protein